MAITGHTSIEEIESEKYHWIKENDLGKTEEKKKLKIPS